VKRGHLRTSKKDFPTATEMGSVEQDIVATAMSYSAATERRRRSRWASVTRWQAAQKLEREFQKELFKKCRVLRGMLRKIGKVAKTK
jgi:hypothetical protein